MSSGDCWPRDVSRKLHRGPRGTGAVTIPAHQTTALYTHVPVHARLLVDVEGDSRVVVTAQSDGSQQRVLFSGSGSAGPVDLAPWAGRLVRLAFRPESGPAEGTRCMIRRLELESPDAEHGPDLPAIAHGRKPNIVVYVVGNVRADHLGCYGYARPTTPRIDRLSETAIVFTDAVAQSSWTLPATASLLTGLTPPHHGAHAVGLAIRPEAPSLASLLAGAGYRSAAFVTNSLGSADFGHARGFDAFHLYPERPRQRPSVYLPSSVLFRRVRRWLARGPHEPFLLYVHATDPDWPYRPPPRYLRPFGLRSAADPAVRRVVDSAWPFFFGSARWGERRSAIPPEDLVVLRGLYDGELRLADDFFGRLLDLLVERRQLDDSVVVLTSDHGEEFQEHGGLAHGQTLHEEILHVPLVVRLPGGAAGGSRVAGTVQQVDILPTLLAVAGLPVPAGLDGRNLFATATDSEAYSSLDLMGVAAEAITRGDWKVVRHLAGERAERHPMEAYDRTEDRDEHDDLAATAAVAVGYGRQRLDALGSEASPGPSVDPARLEGLRALGYVQD